jgi:hypothetical protein
MHPHEPMSGHILPVIMSWRLGIELVHLAGSITGQLDPEKFWFAWERGAESHHRRIRRHLGSLGDGSRAPR